MFSTDKPVSKRTAALVLKGCLLALWVWLVAVPGHAQSVDLTAPVIQIDELTNGVAERIQVFTVQIDEDDELQEVTLYYRRSGELPYTPVSMQALGNTGYFSASIETDILDLRTIEYYVQAQDVSGNRTLSGFAFDPYRRTLRASPTPLPPVETPTQLNAPPLPTEPTAPPAAAPLLQRRWVQIALGVVVVGLAASLASDSGGEDTRIVPLRFNLQ